ncbi:MAG: PorV/PorQ family protein [Candidatus Neomarinimicrobiota bacterium]
MKKTNLTALIFGLSMLWGGSEGYAGSFLRMGASARSMGMGSGFTAEIDHGFPAYHNPASLVFLKKREIGFSHHFLPLSRRFNSTSFSTALPPTAALGLAWVSSGTDKIDGRTSSGQHTQYLSTAEDAVFFTFAQKLTSWFSLGINIKILRHQLPMNTGSLTGKGTGFDMALFIHTEKKANLAFMIQDINSRYHWNTDGIFDKNTSQYVEYFPTIYRLGTTFYYKDIYFAGDLGLITADESVQGYSFRLGAEYTFRDKYYLRAGFGNGRIAVGAGLDWSFLKLNDAHLDYAFVLEAPAGLAHVFTYAFSF